MGIQNQGRVDVDVLPHVDELLEQVSARVAPAWPLDRAIAVNPLWGFVGRPRHEVSLELADWVGARTTLPPEWYPEAFAAGRFGRAHLQAASARLGAGLSADVVLAALSQAGSPNRRRPLVADVVDRVLGPFPDRSAAELVVHLVGRHCLPHLGGTGVAGLYATWWAASSVDAGLGRSLGLPRLHEAVARLPQDPRALVSQGLLRLQIPADEAEGYLTALLLHVGGWASACAYRRWEARQAGGRYHRAPRPAPRLGAGPGGGGRTTGGAGLGRRPGRLGQPRRRAGRRRPRPAGGPPRPGAGRARRPR